MPYANPEDLQKWRLEHHDKVRAYKRKWRLEHHDKVRAYKRKWRLEHHDKVRAYKRIVKRCPTCNKKIIVRKDRTVRICPICGQRLRISKTLSSNPNHNNVGGIRLKVI